MLKVFAQAPGTSTQDTHVFSFTSATAARMEADAIKDALSKAIQSVKSGGGLPAAPGGAGASSAAMAIASAVSSTVNGRKDSHTWSDDERLKQDVELQQSLLKSNSLLSKTFMESLRTKPESITSSQFTAQFWSTRIQLLRAHAIEKNQMRAAYNVLSSIKPMTVDNATKLSISKEQIQLIFNQHPLVKTVYDENVPRLSEEAFWSRFFQSRLFKKLKGERLSENDSNDPVLDKYLSHDDDAERATRVLASHVPHIIDVEGNEENHSQRKGNQPDRTMRPTSIDKVPIIRTLNALSEKLLSHVAPNDIDPSLPIGVDEETFNSLALRDLQGDAAENRVILNIRDQSRFFSSDKTSGISSDAALYSQQNPSKVLKSLLLDLTHASSSTNLSIARGLHDSSSSSSSSDTPPNPKRKKRGHPGSKTSLKAATTQIFSLIHQHSQQTPSPTSTSGLTPATFDRLLLTHATTTEFLSHFWSAFLSGAPSRAGEITKLVETLDRAMDRIGAVGADAEKERQTEIEKLKRQVREFYERTGRKRRVDYEGVGGGRGAVEGLMRPTVRAIEGTMREYARALGEKGEEG